MARGHNDWFEVVPKREVTIRPNLFYPSGKVLFYDDFEHEAQYSDSTIPTGTTKTYTTERASSGNFSVKLITTGGATNENQLIYYVPLIRSKQIGAQYSLSIPAVRPDNAMLFLRAYNGTTYFEAGVRWTGGNVKLEYQDSAGNWKDTGVGNVQIPQNKHPFSKFKVIADFNKNEFVEVRLNEHYVDLRGIALREHDDATTPRFLLIIGNYNRTAVSKTLYVDDVVITEESL